jgi:hypothetical protein
MPLSSTVSQGMAESGVPSTQKGSNSLPEIELGSNRRKGDVDFRPHLPLAFQLVRNFETSKLDLKVSQKWL